MFVARDLMVHAECGAAQARLAQIASASGLASASQAAYHDSLTHLIRVGPLGDTPGLAKLVAVRALDPVYRDETMTVALRWEATGAAGGLFPVLDANISLAPAAEHATQPTLTGSYRPPLGRIGAALDKAILNRVAAATIHALLHSIADALTSPAATGCVADHTSAGWQPVRRQKCPDERQGPDITCLHERSGAGRAETASRVQSP
jgi:hypothetical protein